MNLKPYTMAFPQKYRHRPIRLAIIELFMQTPYNGANEIAKAINVPVNQVHDAINEWLANDKTITVKSKMNE